MGLAGERVVARLRNRLYGHILTQEMGFFDGRKTGELVSRLGSDTVLVQQATTNSIAEASVGLIKVVGSIVLMFDISTKLTGLVIGAAIVIGLMCIPFGTFLGKVSKKYQDALGKAATDSTEAMGAMRTVRAFNGETMEAGRYSRSIGDPDHGWCPPDDDSTLRKGFEKAFVGSLFGTLGFFVFLGTMYCSLWYGFNLVIDGELSFGKLTAFQSYIFQIAFGLGALSAHVIKLFEAQGGALRIFELLKREPELPESSDEGNKPVKFKGEVSFEDVKFAYPSRQDVNVLNGYTLNVPAETTAAIVGTSGSGKSTVLALLSRFYEPSGGRIVVDGHSVCDLDRKWLRSHMALVQQEPVLFGVSIRENVCYGLSREVTDEEVTQVCLQANVHEFVTAFPEGYDTLVGERGVRLSGGQKQRLAIARALLVAPKILLLDEATSALDAESEHLVQEAIDRMMIGRTVLVVAHRLSTVRDADQIAVTADGAVVDVGKHDELLLRCETYQNLVQRQMMSNGDDGDDDIVASPKALVQTRSCMQLTS